MYIFKRSCLRRRLIKSFAASALHRHRINRDTIAVLGLNEHTVRIHHVKSLGSEAANGIVHVKFFKGESLKLLDAERLPSNAGDF